MSNKCHSLCAENRRVIGNMKQVGTNQSEIAQAIRFTQATVSKRLSRDDGQRCYRPP